MGTVNNYALKFFLIFYRETGTGARQERLSSVTKQSTQWICTPAAAAARRVCPKAGSI